MKIQNKYNIQDFVYLATDPEQYRRIVTEIRTNGKEIRYVVMCGETESVHYEYELSADKNVI